MAFSRVDESRGTRYGTPYSSRSSLDCASTGVDARAVSGYFRLSVVRPNSVQLPSAFFTLSTTSSSPVSSRR